MKKKDYIGQVSKVVLVVIVFALASCGAESYMSNEARKGHGSSGRSSGGFFSFLEGIGKATYGGALNGIDMLKITLKGEKGTWTKTDSKIAKSEAETHPNLIHGIDGRNPLDGICDNYLEMSPADRVNVLVAVAASVAYGEGHFGSKGNGGERNSYRRSLGRFQISHGAESWGCWTGGYRPYSASASLDCVYKIMDGQYRKGLPVANNKSYWSVLRPNKFLKSKFMATFTKVAPQCQKRYHWVRTKAYPGPSLSDYERTQLEEKDRMI